MPLQAPGLGQGKPEVSAWLAPAEGLGGEEGTGGNKRGRETSSQCLLPGQGWGDHQDPGVSPLRLLVLGQTTQQRLVASLQGQRWVTPTRCYRGAW